MPTKTLNYLRHLRKSNAEAKKTECERSMTDKTAAIEDESLSSDSDRYSFWRNDEDKSLGTFAGRWSRDISERSNVSAMSCPDSVLMGQRSCLKKHGTPRRASIQVRGEVELYLPGWSSPVRRPTLITFDETVDIKEVLPANELTQDEENLWFQEEEYTTMRKKCFRVAEAFLSGNKIKGKLCIRGLESILDHENRRDAKENAWDSVLNEQYLQREEGCFDDEYLGRVCRFATRRSSKEAMNRAEQDERAAKRYLQGTRLLCS